MKIKKSLVIPILGYQALISNIPLPEEKKMPDDPPRQEFRTDIFRPIMVSDSGTSSVVSLR